MSGVFYCHGCEVAVVPSAAALDRALDGPAGVMEVMCPVCHRKLVTWQPAKRTPRREAVPTRGRHGVPVSQERGRELFAQMRQALAENGFLS